MVVSKFKIEANSKDHNPHQVAGSVTLTAVTSGSVENEKFFEWTPAGLINMSTINSEAIKQFKTGDEKYVLFLSADEYDSINARLAGVEKKEKNPRRIETIVKGATYVVPEFEVTNDGIVETENPQIIYFCKGDKKDQDIPRQSGFFTETLIAVAKKYLEDVNVGPLASRDTSVAITKLDEALMWLDKRKADRKERGVFETMKP